MEIYGQMEKIATATVSLSISQCEFLSPYISEGDKEPSWDGNIYIHKDKHKTKTGIKKVPVQVKGKSCDDLSKSEIKYPINTEDLNNYLYDGGVVFFIVYIRKNRTDTKIYYVSLLPIKIRLLISEAKDQKTINVNLAEFPSDSNEKATIFLNFYENSLKQASFTIGKLPSVDELIENNVLESLSMSVSGFGLDSKDPKKAFFNNEIYIYANIRGFSIPQPLEIIPIGLHTTEIIEKPICANGKFFYEQYELVRSKDKSIINFGKSFHLKLYNTPTWKIDFNLTGNLKEQIRDMEFLLEILSSKSFEIASISIPMVIDSKNRTKIDIVALERTCQYYKKIDYVLDLLGSSQSLDMSSLSKGDWANIRMLMKAFIDKKPIEGLPSDINLVAILDISNLHFTMVFSRNEDQKSYTLLDFFKTKIDLHATDSSGKQSPVSQFCLFRSKHYIELSNINYDIIVSSFREIRNFDQVNYSLLEMIIAYDRTGCDKLYESINDIADLLMNCPDDILRHSIRLLNKLQVIKRKRDLAQNEIRSLCAIIESGQETEEILVGSYLLLDNQSAAESHFHELEPEIQSNFRKYPIFKFARFS
jgi:hypothetical protein